MRAFGMISLLISVAIVGYLTMLQMGGPKSEGGSAGANYQKAEEVARRAAVTVDARAVELALRNYYAQYQKYPPDLETLRKEGLIDHVPDGLQYNPETGAVNSAP